MFVSSSRIALSFWKFILNQEQARLHRNQCEPASKPLQEQESPIDCSWTSDEQKGLFRSRCNPPPCSEAAVLINRRLLNFAAACLSGIYCFIT
jgi:hypothetical protein